MVGGIYERPGASSVKNEARRQLLARWSGCLARAGKKLDPASSFVRTDTITNEKCEKSETPWIDKARNTSYQRCALPQVGPKKGPQLTVNGTTAF